MKVWLEINNCSECPYERGPAVCTHPSRLIKIASGGYRMKRHMLAYDRKIPKWCPLTTNNRRRVSGSRTV